MAGAALVCAAFGALYVTSEQVVGVATRAPSSSATGSDECSLTWTDPWTEERQQRVRACESGNMDESLWDLRAFPSPFGFMTTTDTSLLVGPATALALVGAAAGAAFAPTRKSKARPALPRPRRSATVASDDGPATGLPTAPSRIATGGQPSRRPGSGVAIAWGSEDHGRTRPPAAADRTVTLAAGGWHNLAVTYDGSIVGSGSNSYGRAQPPLGIGGALDAAAGRNHSLALLANGSVVAWGNNDYGQSDAPHGSFRAVSAGCWHNLAIDTDGRVVAWGLGKQGQTDVPTSVLRGRATAVSAGSRHSLALLDDGSVVAWGSNRFGQCDVPRGLDSVVQVAAGATHSLALRADGTVVAWGSDLKRQVSGSEQVRDAVQIAAGWDYSLAADRAGTIHAWGDHPMKTAGGPLPPLRALAAGGEHAFTLHA